MAGASPEVVILTVSPTGEVTSWQQSDRATRTRRMRLEGLDRQLVRHFESWLTLRQRTWDLEELRTFGMLLHRCLFPPEQNGIWTWLRDRINQTRDTGGLRLLLAFPAGSDNAYLTRTPWEYLHSPEWDQPGYFLARRSGLVLSRTVPAGLDPEPPEPLRTLRVLPVVADPDPDGYGKVDAGPVLQQLASLHTSSRFHVLPVVEQATADRLQQAVAAGAPDLVHYIGHGDYRSDTGRGRLALHSPDPDELVDWVDEERFGEILCGQRQVAPPRAVILHTCLGGSSNFSIRFAGLAPELVRRGVHCVVAMQYAIVDRHALTFSTTLYERLANGDQLDVAVQACRDQLAASYPKEPRLVGVPMVYLRNAEPLLAGPASPNGGVP